ncbi:RimK family alpha-L-glutamate ligase [Candidatus Woesearchaeota archaeon]|nr:RimK family alpha-L-glutamate ligase [Candidatus Woesearchaeota archaeon]
MKLGIISQISESSKMIQKECLDYFDKVDMINIKDVSVEAATKVLETVSERKKIDIYDCLYLRGSYKNALLLRAISESCRNKIYTPIRPEAFTVGHDKFLTILELQKQGIDIPKTYVASTISSAKKILEGVNYPVIVKIPSGTHGKGVMVADTFAAASSVLDTLEVFKQPYIIQDYVETNATDLRAIVIGDKVIAAMRRKASNGELRANIHMGGTGTPIELDYATERVAVKAANAIGADICAVDILESRKPKVIEVNLSPGLRGITSVTKKNVAGKIGKFLYDRTQQFIESKKKQDFKDIIGVINKDEREIVTNLDIKLGKIRLPDIVSKLSEIKDEEEVVIKVNKGKIEIEKH